MNLSSVEAAPVVPFTIRGHLTARELEILELLAEGHTAKECAYLLHVAHGTVRTHMQRLYLKLGASTKTGAVVNAMRAGVIS